MNPTLQQVHNINEPLTDFSLMFLQKDGFVADKVFPIKEVEHKSSSYFTYPRGSFNTPSMKQRSVGTTVEVMDYDIDMATYTTQVWALGRHLDEQIEANADPIISLELEATQALTLQLQLQKETLFASSFFTTDVWTNTWTGEASAPSTNQFLQWGSTAGVPNASATPIEDIRNMKRAIILSSGNVGEPNTLVLPKLVYDVLLGVPEIVSRIVYAQKQANAALVTKDILAQLFEVDQILVSTAVYNTAAYGASESNAFVLGNGALLAYVPPSIGVRTPAAGVNFTWSKYGPSRVTSYPWMPTRSTHVEIESAFEYNLVSADLGGFFYQPLS
jgi:hypothetical protein